MALSVVAQLSFDFDQIVKPPEAKTPYQESYVRGDLGNRKTPTRHSSEPAAVEPQESLLDWENRAKASSAAPRGKKSRAKQILTAIRILNTLDCEQRPATQDEKTALAQFGGFGAVALRLFPDPVTGNYQDAGWQQLGMELKALLSPEDYASAKRTTFNAFYTAPVVMQAMHQALKRLGIRENSLVLEPGCGIGNFMGTAPRKLRFIGVELDRTSGRIAQALYPEHDIRIEGFQETQLAPGSIDAVIGNVPFASVKLRYGGVKFSLHDYFFAKSVDLLRPGGVLALVTSHFTLDKESATIREYLAERADFLGAIRLPSDAFKNEGTAVVTDIVLLKKRDPGQEPKHVDQEWLATGPLEMDGSRVTINQYFVNHPEMVLGEFSTQDTLYGGTGYSVVSNGNLAEQLSAAVELLPAIERSESVAKQPAPERFQRPPPAKHVTTGSFYVDDEGGIRQVAGGKTSEPVKHGETQLKAHGTKMGKRMAALIGLRDAARGVLQSQNEGWPVAEREASRRELNWRYDCFERDYGPINKTTFSQTRSKAQTRRMPNLVKFKQDPDAMLVMSLEQYDEVTGQATKAAIMREDVVGPKPKRSSVNSAEEGLLVSLDTHGVVDVPYIGSLYGKSEADVIGELGDLIYQNPETKEFETADVYLSGNVRLKLAAAQAAGPGFAANAAALSTVQPPDVLPGDIDASLGSPWIPVKDVTAFAAKMFGVAPTAIHVGHLRQEAFWMVDADYSAMQSVAATSDYGTARVNGTRLLDLALNMKSPIVYDMIESAGGEQRVVNQEETLAAKERQRLLKENFKAWIFADPERTERMVRIYNDTYNNLRLRRFDGSHLEFPGMNQTISLRPHQLDAIWRSMSSGNTLLAHAVGAGKTYVMAAAGMKLHQAGIAKKPMYVVPNHMLEQFAREFLQLYPNAKLLVTTKEDMSRERRKFLTAKIATGNWHGIIATHSSFERIAMSGEYQARFINQQIAEYEQLLCDVQSQTMGEQHRNIIKAIEKQKVSREARLEELMAEEKKDNGLVFDELGVDHIFIDESHYFKNLETPTKMQRVAGIQTGGSQRAFDLYMKARFLDEKHLGHGLTFATGTPISNTMVEMYTVQRFLDPQGLCDRGIEHFDAWAATFGEVVETAEISPDGASMRPRSRFARFNNLPELQQMFRAFTDVQTAQMLQLPCPRLMTGKPITVACPMSDEQADLQANLVERYEHIRSGGVDPRVDNALAITTDGRKLSLDARMLSAEAEDYAESKVNALVNNVVRIYRETLAFRGTQLVFCDLGVKANAWGYSAYQDVTGKLMRAGIATSEIAAMGEASSDAKKQALFERVRNGSVRVLLGSTQKMGTGTNVQKRLVALHHLDAPWKPAEVEQRDGRILRQGNDNEEVAIYRYVTEGSFDAFMWQALETKARFISQVMTGESAVRRAEDIGSGELSYAEVKAIASGNPAVLTLSEADSELKRLAVLKKNHTDGQYLSRHRVRELPRLIDELTVRSTGLANDDETLLRNADGEFVIRGRVMHPEDMLDAIGGAMETYSKGNTSPAKLVLGTYRGLEFGIVEWVNGRKSVYLKGEVQRATDLANNAMGPRAVLNAASRLSSSYAVEIEKCEEELELAKRQLVDHQARIGEAFLHDKHIENLSALRDELRAALSGNATSTNGTEESRPIELIAEEVKALLHSNSTSSVSRVESSERVVTEEEPIAARVRKRMRLLNIEDVTSDQPVEVETEAEPQESYEEISDLADVSFQRKGDVKQWRGEETKKNYSDNWLSLVQAQLF